VTAAERRRNRVKIMNSRFKPPSIVASWLVNTRGFAIFMIVVLVLNAVIIGIDVECTLRWPNRFTWLHVTVEIISVIGASVNSDILSHESSGRKKSCIFQQKSANFPQRKS